MNHIYWDVDKISMLTDRMNAANHSHGMIQFFLCPEDKLNIKVSNKSIEARAVFVNANIMHSFKTDGKICFTSVIEPASSIGISLSQLMNENDYYALKDEKIKEINENVINMVDDFTKEPYFKLMESLSKGLGLKGTEVILDDRVLELLGMLEHCTCHDHSIDTYADKLCISSSRLSHIFVEEIGIPLKKYLILHQLERAFSLILQGSRITDAALEAGFDTPSHFASTVKRLMGLPARNTIKDSGFLKVY
ncbi:MAG: AraC family transcriptional regulator [Eubacterium sp.]|nr:AraC family transcriptional regulator [Eubacterium sp.]